MKNPGFALNQKRASADIEEGPLGATVDTERLVQSKPIGRTFTLGVSARF